MNCRFSTLCWLAISAPTPTAVSKVELLACSAKAPTAVLASSAAAPTAVLKLPVLLLHYETQPTAALYPLVVRLKSASLPSAVLKLG